MPEVNFILYLFAYIFFIFSFVQNKYKIFPLIPSAIFMAIISQSREFGVAGNDDLYILWLVASGEVPIELVNRESGAELFLELIAYNHSSFLFMAALLSFSVYFIMLRVVVYSLFKGLNIQPYMQFSLVSLAFFSIVYGINLQLFRQVTSISLFFIGMYAFRKQTVMQIFIFFTAVLFHVYTLLLLVAYYAKVDRKLIFVSVLASIFLVASNSHLLFLEKFLYYKNISADLALFDLGALSRGDVFRMVFIPILVILYCLRVSYPETTALMRVSILTFVAGIFSIITFRDSMMVFRVLLPFYIVFSPIFLYFVVAMTPRYNVVFFIPIILWSTVLAFKQLSSFLSPDCGSGFGFGCG